MARNQALDWYRRRTLAPQHSTEELVALKESKGSSVAVCLPALNEEATIGRICATVVDELQGSGLVDELLVIDTGSTDRTATTASEAGARVYLADEVLPGHPPSEVRGGKGEALWKSLTLVRSELVVWLDSDTHNFSSHFVTALAGPLLDDGSIVFTKGFYHRPISTPGGLTTGGARVTEILVRPLLQLLHPSLIGFVQPLSGEYGGRVEALRQIPFWSGYGVDIGLLLQLERRFGLDAMAQVDLGTRIHRNRDVSSLGRMAFQVGTALLSELEESGRVTLPTDMGHELLQFSGGALSPEPLSHDLEVVRFPPAAAHSSL